MERGIVLVGLNHRSAPVEVRERVAFANGRLEPSLRRLMGVEGVAEGAILSTCNRVEVVACGPDPAAVGAVLPGFLAREHGVPEPALAGHLYTHTDREAVRHLFRVAASLDSMVVGEPQILGQMKEQYAAAAAAGASGQILHRCFHRSFSVAKRIRRETAVAEKAVSIGSAALELSRGIFDRLAHKSALLLGARPLGELTARPLPAPGGGSGRAWSPRPAAPASARPSRQKPSWTPRSTRSGAGSRASTSCPPSSRCASGWRRYAGTRSSAAWRRSARSTRDSARRSSA